MGRVVGYFTSRHGMPTTYERLPVFLNSANDLDVKYVQRTGYFTSRFSCPASQTASKAALNVRHSIAATVKQYRTLTAGHKLPAFVYRKGATTISQELGAYSYSSGRLNQRHSIIGRWALVGGRFQGNHSLRVAVPRKGAVTARYSLDRYVDAATTLHARHALVSRSKTGWSLNSAHSLSATKKSYTRFISRYALPIWVRAAGAWSWRHNLAAYQSRTGYANSGHDVLIYTRGMRLFSGHHALRLSEISVRFLNGRQALLVDEFNDELAKDVHTWAVNGRTGAPSRYRQFPFHGYALSFGGLAAATDGLYALDASDDDGAGIDGEFKTPWYDARQPNVGGDLLKRFVSTIFGGNIDAIEVIPETDDEDDPGDALYRRGTGIQNHKRIRVKFRQGYKGRLIRLTVRNYEGGALDIESADMEIEHLPSRER